MSTDYNLQLVALSVFIAVVASYTALSMVRQRQRGWRNQAAPATVMGMGIWTMHFTGMLAFHLPVALHYDLWLTLLSMLLALGASGLSFGLMSMAALTARNIIRGGVCMGSGVAAMHYTGMAAMHMAPPIHYDMPLLLLSIAIAIGAACAALYFTFCRPLDAWRRIGVALVMGLAVSGMHYTGMAAAHFAADSVSLARGWTLDNATLAGAIGGSVLLVLFWLLFYSLAQSFASLWSLLALIVAGEIAIMGLLKSVPAVSQAAEIETLLDAGMLGLFLLPILHRLRQMQESLQTGYRQQSVLNSLLNAPMERFSLDEFLAWLLDTVLETPWLALLPKGGIFLFDDGRQELILRASRNLAASIQASCSRVRLGQCLCGRVAASGELLFAAHVDERHDIRYDGMADHGHYCVPLNLHQQRVGVLVLYVETDHRRSQQEADFLQMIGNTLAILIRRKQAEYALRLSEAVFCNADEGIIITDANNRIVRVNQAFQTITGYLDSEVAGYDPKLLKSGRQDAAFYQRMWQDLRTRGGWRGMVWNRRKSGEDYPAWLNIRAMYDEHGHLKHFVGIFSDITEHMRAQAALKDALQAAEEATRAKSEFLANMSHEIRTPMNAVLGLTMLALDDLAAGVDGKLRGYLEQIDDSAQYLLGILNDVLDFSKIEAGKMDIERAPVKLAELIERTCAMAEHQSTTKGLLLEVRQDAALPATIMGDSMRITQILTNLLSNAVKFTREGTVTVSTRVVGQTARDVGIQIQVSDTGIGMDETTLANLFQPFTQADGSTSRRFGGTGLGLAITRRLVDLMGGGLEVTSIPGMGSTFSVALTLETTSVAAAEQFSGDGDWRGRYAGKHLLLVEDNPVNQLVAKAVLEKFGFAIDVADDGKKAVEIVCAAVAVPYDIVIMDVQMPEMDGIRATRLIRQFHPPARLPIVAMTANAFEQDRLDALEAGMNAHIAKPINADNIADVLARVLGK
ncbi:MAG: response regulator [Methylococcaceae bacterium]|nr:MAG: response regulator [Methylococcaceae bacterium]